MTDAPKDANHCIKDLHRLVEEYPADVAIYCLASMLGEIIVNTAKDCADAEERVERVTEQIEDKVAINFDVCDAVKEQVDGDTGTLIWGAAAIGKEISRAPRQVHHLHDRRLLPVDKVGGQLVGKRGKLRKPNSWPKGEKT